LQAISELSNHIGRQIRCAVEMVYLAHNGQSRISGQPHIIHPLEVMKTLADIGMEPDTLLAAVLHMSTMVIKSCTSHSHGTAGHHRGHPAQP
jgi:(p)ppGpp synthase/HD superfamily hydrolase